MPVTTPAAYVDDLHDADHFAHVLTHLFTPALEQAGYTVIPPKMLGAALIHAEIIKHLEQADLVLADLSGSNANVYFELGIRTSLDRPVVLVKDGRTSTIPFDLGPINILAYNESLAPWTLEEEVKHLAEHISNVPTDGDSGNAMWKYFGLTKRGGPTEAGSLEAKVDLLLAETTKRRLESPPAIFISNDERLMQFENRVNAILPGGISIEELAFNSGNSQVSVHISGPLSATIKTEIRDIASYYGLTVRELSGHPVTGMDLIERELGGRVIEEIEKS
jgi:hypothetical protein